MKTITAKQISKLSVQTLIKQAIKNLEHDLKRWHEFKKSPRHVTHFKHGVCELMPMADDEFYTYKYVNGHPNNPELNKSSITAIGMLADVATGYPQLLCDMTILTAIRTAATSAIAAKHLAKKHSHALGLIGTGAQSEFQVLAMMQLFDIKTIRYYDRDKKAMQKFKENTQDFNVNLIQCKNAEQVVQDVDILTTCICEKKHVELFSYQSIAKHSDLFINAIGGDCPGKTELDAEILKHSKIVMEYYKQTKDEGEVQNLEADYDYTELWEIVSGKKSGRTKKDNCIVFDSVGFALADYSALCMLNKFDMGKNIDILPDLPDSKNLYSVF